MQYKCDKDNKRLYDYKSEMSNNILGQSQRSNAETEENLFVNCWLPFTITLKANTQNGYLWYTEDFDKDKVKLIEQIKEPLPMYSGCKQHFKFQSLESGITNISFIYKRSWETNPYNKKYFTVSIS